MHFPTAKAKQSLDQPKRSLCTEPEIPVPTWSPRPLFSSYSKIPNQVVPSPFEDMLKLLSWVQFLWCSYLQMRECMGRYWVCEVRCLYMCV